MLNVGETFIDISGSDLGVSRGKLKLHSQILVPCIFRSVSPRLEDDDALKCSSDNFA